MEGERELASMLQGWAAASQRIERARTERCLTITEVADFVDDLLPSAERERAAEHLSHCGYCVREVASLVRATREVEEAMRLKAALGSLTHRVGACLRLFVDEARGAFTRADALLQSLTPAVRMELPSLAPGLAMAGTRAVVEDEDEDTADSDPEALHEVVLHAEGLPGAVLLCGEDEGGSVTVSLPEPWEVHLVTLDGAIQRLPVEEGGGRYYATITGMPAGSYYLTLLAPSS